MSQVITKEEVFYENIEAFLPNTFHLELKKKVCLKLTDGFEYFDTYFSPLIYLYIVQLSLKHV